MTHSTTGKTPDYCDIKSLALWTWRSFRRLRVGMMLSTTTDPSSREQKTDIQILSGLSVRSGEHQDHGWTCPQMFLETSAGLAARLMTPPTDVKAG